MGTLVLDHVFKRYPGGVTAVNDLCLDVHDGEFMVVVGPSGCGKSTALRMVAGLEEISQGTVQLDGTVVNGVEPRDRDVAMVFQSYALYPHLTIHDNLGFPLRQQRVPKAQRKERIRQVADSLGLTDLLEKKPAQLSGGQRQRVAMGRAIVRAPRLFLMDEPLSNLDTKLRGLLRTEIHAIQRRLGVTTMYVTHDQVEAMTLGDRVAVMRDGVLQQVGTPREVYDEPANLFVASFLGTPGMNLFDGQVELRDGAPCVVIGGAALAIDAQELGRQPRLRERDGAAVVVGIRPEALELAGSGVQARTVPAVVEETEQLGSSVLAYVAIAGARDAVSLGAAAEAEGGGDGDVLITGRHAWAVGRFGPATTFGDHDRLALAVQAGAMRFFDAQTGERL